MMKTIRKNSKDKQKIFGVLGIDPLTTEKDEEFRRLYMNSKKGKNTLE
jgi:hypothetical protein